MAYLSDNRCAFLELKEDLLKQCPPFSCEKDKGIEEFFTSEYQLFARQLFGKSYGFSTSSRHGLLSPTTRRAAVTS